MTRIRESKSQLHILFLIQFAVQYFSHREYNIWYQKPSLNLINIVIPFTISGL